MPSLIVLFHGIENLVPQLLMLSVLPGLILIVTLFLSFSQLSRVSAKDKGQLVSVLFPVNVFRPKFAAAGLPTNLRNAQLGSFFNSALFLLLVGSGPKRSMPIEKLGSSWLVSSIF